MRTHGTVSCYNSGCRCSLCKKASSLASQEYYEKHKDKAISRAKEWSKNNPDKRKQIANNWATNNIAQVIKTMREYRKNNPEKYAAHTALNNALRSGIITKPTTCELCGEEKPLDGHHKDYKLVLDVVWLCRQCHKKLNKE